MATLAWISSHGHLSPIVIEDDWRSTTPIRKDEYQGDVGVEFRLGVMVSKIKLPGDIGERARLPLGNPNRIGLDELARMYPPPPPKETSNAPVPAG